MTRAPPPRWGTSSPTPPARGGGAGFIKLVLQQDMQYLMGNQLPNAHRADRLNHHVVLSRKGPSLHPGIIFPSGSLVKFLVGVAQINVNALVKFHTQHVFEAGDCLRAGLNGNFSLCFVGWPVGEA